MDGCHIYIQYKSINLLFIISSDCQKNKPLWTTLHLNEIFDLNSKLNVSQVRYYYSSFTFLWLIHRLLDTNGWLSQQYTHEIDQTMDGVQINIANITILSPEVKSQLNNFSSRASSMNLSNIIQQVHCILHFQKHTSTYCLWNQMTYNLITSTYEHYPYG